MGDNKSVFTQPSLEQLQGFVAGDPIVQDEVVRLLLPQMARWAIGHYSNLPPDEIQSTVNLVFAETCRKHTRYAPQRAKLTTYLIGLIRLRLNDLYRDITGEPELSVSFDAHEKLVQLPYYDSDTIDTATRVARDEFFQEVSLLLDDVEEAFLDLMRHGEKRQEVFAATLERYGQRVQDPARETKNMKERLFRKLRAAARELDYELDDLLST